MRSYACFLFILLPFVAAGQGNRQAACYPVSGDWIYARDVAAAVPEFKALPPDLQIGYAPVPGTERVLWAADLNRLAGLHQIQLKLRENVCFAWELALPNQDQIRDAIKKTFPDSDVRVEIVEQSQAGVPKGELVFPIEGLSALSDKPVTWKGFVRYTASRRFSTWVLAKVSVRESHLVTNKLVRAGEVFDASECATELYQGPLMRQKTIQDSAQLVGRIARRDLPPGTVLVEGLFDAPKEVQQGEIVTVLIDSGAAHVETQGIAQQTGRRGEVITVRNPTSGRDFRAVIQDKKRVLVVPGGPIGLVGEETKS